MVLAVIEQRIAPFIGGRVAIGGNFPFIVPIVKACFFIGRHEAPVFFVYSARLFWFELVRWRDDCFNCRYRFRGQCASECQPVNFVRC